MVLLELPPGRRPPTRFVWPAGDTPVLMSYLTISLQLPNLNGVDAMLCWASRGFQTRFLGDHHLGPWSS